MVEPNSERPTAVRRKPAAITYSAAQEQWWEQSQQRAPHNETHSATLLQDPPLQQIEKRLSYHSLSTMASSEQAEPTNYSVKLTNDQTPAQPIQEPPSDSGIGPDDAPRTRSSTFGLKSINTNNQATAGANSQKSPFTPQNRSAVTQSPAVQAGPSNTRPHSTSQPVPMSSLVHNTVLPAGSSSGASRPSTATRSPFTTPITSPPRNRPNQVLLVNPTSTTALTSLMLSTLRPILPNMLEVTAYNAPYPAPTAIDSMVDSVLSSETVLRDFAKYSTNNGETIQNFDALLIANFSKHPLIDALRESYDVPVIGILEASLYVARMLGGRFGIITSGTRMKYQIDDAVAAYGLSHFFVGIESLHINPLDLLSMSSASPATSPDRSSQTSIPSNTSRPRDELHKRLALLSRALVVKGADTIILGSEFLTNSDAIRAVKNAVRDEDGRRTVNVIDAVEAGVTMLNGLIAMGLPTSKKGMFRSERDTRRARGQTWL